MKVKLFVDIWDVSRDELALLVGRSKDTVNHWFVDPGSPSYAEPTREVKNFLTLVHMVWTIRKFMDDFVPKHILNMYDLVMSRMREKDE